MVGPCHKDFRSAGARYCGSLGENIANRNVSSTTPLTLCHSTIKRKPETPAAFPVTCNHTLEKCVLCMTIHSDSVDEIGKRCAQTVSKGPVEPAGPLIGSLMPCWFRMRALEHRQHERVRILLTHNAHQCAASLGPIDRKYSCPLVKTLTS